jgi:L-ascorbate metabolism protein UlaG (beta-lactamase superfamily)
LKGCLFGQPFVFLVIFITMKLIKLNNDSSWWVQIEHHRFLIDPWFTPSQIDVAPWFSEQFHLDPQPTMEEIPSFDFIFISHPFNDHCNKETLLQFSKDIPIYGPSNVLKKIKKWNHFNQLNHFGLAPLKITQFKAEQALDLVHNGYLFEDTGKSLFYAPHGTKLKSAIHPVDCLITTSTLFHLPFWLGGTVNLGWKAADNLAKITKAKHILSTHDEQKIGKGLVEKLAKKEYLISNTQSVMHFLKPMEPFHIA